LLKQGEKTMSQMIFLTFLALSLTGCASVNTYVDPAPRPGLATVQNHFKRNGAFDWQRSNIYSIDNKVISYAFMLSPDSYKANVTPGMHSIVVQSEFLRGFGNGPYAAMVELKAALNPGMTYTLNETIDGLNAKVWLADAAGNRRSEIASAPFHAEQQNNVIFMPVIVH
jgi:hypothetical protein